MPPFPSHTSHVGLGAARNFSAGAQPFTNVVSNVPLALRALGGEGLDDRKWRREVRQVRRDLRTAAKGKGREVPSLERQQIRREEFKSFFGVEAAEKVAGVEAAAEATPVVLVLPLEPALALSNDVEYDHAGPSSSYRLLPPTVMHSLDAIQMAYTRHAHRVQALSNRLARAGVFEDPTTDVQLVFLVDGRKEVHLTFGPQWNRRDVSQAAGGWRGEEATFWDISGGDEAVDSLLSSVRSDELDMAEHDALKSTLMLPRQADFLSSPSPSISPVSSAYEPPDELDDYEPSLTQEAQVWTDFAYPATDSFSPLSMSVNGDELESYHWSIAFEDERSDSGEPATEASYESGVRDFLLEVEQGMDGQRMFARI